MASSASVLGSIVAARALHSSTDTARRRLHTAQGLGLTLRPLVCSRSFSPAATTRGASLRVQAKATESSTESGTSDLLKEIQESWDKTDDKLAIAGLGFAGLIFLWASTGLISAIDRLPVLPTLFELIGLLFTGWFIYRYLLFKPDREELLKVVDETKNKITGSSD